MSFSLVRSFKSSNVLLICYTLTDKRKIFVGGDNTYQNSYSSECLFVFGFHGSVNNEVMSSPSVNKGIVPGQA